MLHALLKRMIRVGDLTVRLPGGQTHTYGDGSGPKVAVTLTSRGMRQIAAKPAVGLGEAYMDGGIELETGTIWDLLELSGRNKGGDGPRSLYKHLKILAERRLEQWNHRDASRRNVHHHYDLSEDLYRRFLDRDLQYSCAYFARPGMTLEEAQEAKKLHIASKLRLEPGMKVLDIGCGWGGLGLYLGVNYGVDVGDQGAQVIRRCGGGGPGAGEDAKAERQEDEGRPPRGPHSAAWIWARAATGPARSSSSM